MSMCQARGSTWEEEDLREVAVAVFYELKGMKEMPVLAFEGP